MNGISLSRLIIFQRLKIGGAKFIFKPDTPNAIVINGGILTCAPKTGGKIFAGDFGEFDGKNHYLKHLKQFYLLNEITPTSTKMYIKKDEFLHVLEPNLPIMVEPAASDSTDISVSSGTVVSSTSELYGDVYEVTITAAAFGAAKTIPAGSLLVEAETVSASNTAKVAPVVKNANVVFNVDDSAFGDNLLTEGSEAGYNKFIGEISYHRTIFAYRHIGIPKIAPASKTAIEAYYEF